MINSARLPAIASRRNVRPGFFPTVILSGNAARRHILPTVALLSPLPPFRATHGLARPDAKLEEELRETLQGMERRERKLALAEEEMARQRKDHKAELARQLGDIRDASRRMQKDFIHQVEVEQQRVDDLRRQVAGLNEDKATADKRYRKLEEDFSAFRHAQVVSPEGQMRERNAQLTVELQEVKSKLEVALRAKQKYKSQW